MKSQRKQTIINLSAKFIAFSTSLLVSFFLTPYLVNNIGKEAYSFYPIANNFVTYMSIVTMALNSMASRFITIAISQKKIKRANEYFVSVFVGNVIISLVLFPIMLLLVVNIQNILNIPMKLVTSVKVLFSLVFITMITNLLSNVFGVCFFCKNRLDLSAINEVVVGIVRILLYVVLFAFFKPSIIYVGAISLISALIIAGYQYHCTRRLLPEIKLSLKFFNIKAIREILGSGLWNCVNQIGTILLSTLGLMFCNMLYGAGEGADYSIALMIPQFINGIVSMLSSIFLPVITIKYATESKEEVVKYVTLTQKIIGGIDNIPTAAFMAVGINFFQLWTPGVDPHRLQALSILAIGYLLVTSASWPVSNLNTVMNQVKTPAIAMLGTGILNIILILLFYKYSEIGVYSIPLIQLVLFVVNRGVFVLSYSAIKIGKPWYTFYPPIIKNLICASIIFVISRCVNHYIDPQTWPMLILECAFLGCVGLVVNMIIMIGPNEMKDLLRARKNSK